MIYFAKLSENGPIKIGYTRNLQSRMGGLKAQFRISPIVLGTADGDRNTEKELHAKFEHLRYSDSFYVGREWFQPQEELLSEIEAICEPMLISNIREFVCEAARVRYVYPSAYSRVFKRVWRSTLGLLREEEVSETNVRVSMIEAYRTNVVEDVLSDMLCQREVPVLWGFIKPTLISWCSY